MGYLAALVLLSSACAMGASTYPMEAPARPAQDTPGHFVTATSAVRADSESSPVCWNPLVDPRDGTRIVLVNAQAGKVGDYRVPEGRYGVGVGELLRVSCATGAVIAVIPGH